MDGHCLGDPCGAGSGGWRPKRHNACFLYNLALSQTQEQKMVGVGVWIPGETPDQREEVGNFGILCLESGRAVIKILALCAGASTKSESWGCASVIPRVLQ